MADFPIREHYIAVNPVKLMDLFHGNTRVLTVSLFVRDYSQVNRARIIKGDSIVLFSEKSICSCREEQRINDQNSGGPFVCLEGYCENLCQKFIVTAVVKEELSAAIKPFPLFSEWLELSRGEPVKCIHKCVDNNKMVFNL